MSPSAWSTPALALAVLVLVLAVAEVAARTQVVRSALGPPSFGSPSRRFEMQLDGLERYSASGAAVECIVLGNSTTLTGVDPEALAAGYRRRTGANLRCFNFGVSGMTASAAEAVAPILLARHHPSLLVYVVTARDVGENVEGPLLANTPWVRYRRGSFSLDGWLVEHSAAFRYLLLYRQWLDPLRWPGVSSSSGINGEGFFAAEKGLPLSAALWQHTQRAYAEVASRPPSQAELAALSKLVARSAGEGTQVIVVEAPVHERLRRLVEHDGGFYAAAMAEIRRSTRLRRVPFWRVQTRKVIPADGWLDFVHLNRLGAAAFSQWLGGRLGAAVMEGRLDGPRAEPAPA